ncbi:uncharacterized protein LOC110993112 isoform X1 [Pieris rapae]|uniref:uncharacterized protein LOC110993112 isoform X1 n=1 Tax=Pieris rapae TaxID=64459 RepID=UPI001E27E0C9|nr:uncharacterized protein LOC110993112 isoform X1 [Pieris rapae]
MKSLCYVLAINVVLSAANPLDARNASDESQTQSRKVKHTISRIFSVPNNQARTVHDGGYYDQLMKMLTSESVGTSKLEDKDKTSTDFTLLHTIKGVYPESESQNEIHLQTNKNIQTDGAVRILGTKERELNADILNEIIQNLTASNGGKQIRNGKLVIYYDENENPSQNVIEKNENVGNSRLKFANIIRIEEAIHNLFIQYKVPENIYYAIKAQNVDAKDRIKNLIIAFVKFIASEGQVNSDIINKVKILISDDNIDIDLGKLLMTSDANVGVINLDTDPPTNAVSDVIKNIFDGSDKVDSEKNEQISDVTRSLDFAVINELEPSKETPTVNLSVNAKVFTDPTVTSTSLNNLRDIVHKDNSQEIITTIEGNSNLLIPSKVYTKESVNPVVSNVTAKKNIHEAKKNTSDSILGTIIDYNLAKSKQQTERDNRNLLNPVGLQVVKGSITGNIKDMTKSKDILNQKRTQLHSLRTKLDFETLKRILNDVMGDSIPYLQQVDPNVPVFSNIPVEEYLNHNNGKPFLIYVVFPESEKSKMSDPVYHDTFIPTEKDNFYVVDDDIKAILTNYFKNSNTTPELSGENDSNSILHVIKDEIANKEVEQDIKDTKQRIPDKLSPDTIIDIIAKIKNSIGRHRQNKMQHSENTEKELMDYIIKKIYDSKVGKNKLNNEDNLLDIIETITHGTATDQQKKENDIYKQLLILFPNIGHGIIRKGIKTDRLDKLKELLLQLKHSPNDDNTRSITEDPNFFKKYLQAILNHKSANDIDITSEQERYLNLAEELIERMKYLQMELEKRNISRQTQRELIKKEVQEELLKINTDSIESCVKRANKLVELSIEKVLQKSIL